MLSRYKQNLHVDGNKVFSYETHVATIDGNNLVKHGWWSMTTSKHINYVAKEYGLTVIDGEKTKTMEDKTSSHLKTVAMVSAFGNVLCDTPKEKNDWKKRMLSTVHGLSFPDDFDMLPEEEKTKRLDGALTQIS